MTRPIDKALLKKSIAVFQAETVSEPAPSTARSLRAWLADPDILRPPRVVLPYLAVEGRTSLVSGREKIGKSTLIGCVVAAASRGDAVLGVPIARPVRTLWYAIDGKPADTVRRFERLGADLDRVIINDVPRTVSELLTALERDLATHAGIDAVAVDTLSKILAASGVDTNASREVEPVMVKVTDFFHRVNIAAILFYHTGKGGREYRGNTAIGANVDEVLTLRRRGQAEEDDFDDDTTDDGRRLLVQDGRNLRGRLQLTCVDGVYRLFEEANPPRDRILEALRVHGPARNRSELVKRAGGRRSNGLQAVIDLITEGAILETERHIKLAPPVPKSPPVLTKPLHREPDGTTAEFPSSQEFPEGETTREPQREPESTAANPQSSRTGNPTLQKREPASPTPTTQVIERNGVKVRQRLRPTVHGDKWIDEPAEEALL